MHAHMKPILPRILVFAAFASAGLLARAQDRPAAPAPVEFLRPMKNNFSIGVRMIGGAKVNFSGDLGATRFTVSADRVSAGYDNGGPLGDDEGAYDKRPAYEIHATISGVDMRYNTRNDPRGPQGATDRFYTVLTDASGEPLRDEDGKGYYTLTGDYLMHKDEYTRSWSFTSDNPQLRDAPDGMGQQVGFSIYSSTAAADASVTAKSANSPGIELVAGRVIQRFKRFEWGLSVGLGFAEFNAKTRQSVPVKLDFITDWHNIYNTGAEFTGTPTRGDLIRTGTASGGTFPEFAVSGTESPGGFGLTYAGTETDDEGETVIVNGVLETTNPISREAVARETSIDNIENSTKVDQIEGQTADGFWQVKGVYYVMRVGPVVRIPIGRRFSALVGGGYMGAYIGSKFRYEEMVNLPGDAGTIKIAANSDDPENIYETVREKRTFQNGCYVDANFEWWVSTRTGFYVGLGYERLGKYKHELNGRKAEVRMDTGLGWRFGVMTRF